MIIAVDGPAASGKGTLARRIAVYYGLPYLDTGSLYRAVALDLLRDQLDLEDESTATQAALNLSTHRTENLEHPDIRSREVGAAASVIAKHPGVREALLQYQREFANQDRGAVLDGRDIGTVICPHATVKFFVTASAEERAKRRYLELKIKGSSVSQEQILQEIEERDRRDSTRSSAPLQKAADSHLLDTTNLDIETTFNTAVKLIDTSLSRLGQS